MHHRQFLFLQGMPCRFFSELATSFNADGAQVSRINLCFADWFFWRIPGAINYRGSLGDWPRFIEQFIESRGITDLVLLGEQRKYHKEAIAVARKRGIRVTVTDFGYLRPDWITLEQNGMSGCSNFPKNPEAIKQGAAGLDLPDFRTKFQDSDLAMGIGDLVSMYGNLLFWFLYPYYERSDARPHPFLYSAGGLIRSLTKRHRQRVANAQFLSIRASSSPCFVYPLQLEHDFQLIAYSSFRDQNDAIEKVIASFSKAPRFLALIIKSHPWDPGLRSWHKVINHLAKKYQCEHRIYYLDGGDLDEMISYSRGVITVNSTSGIKALQLGKPVKALGQAIYDVVGLTHQGEIDDFWQRPMPPDRVLFDSFIKLLARKYQVRGTFFSRQGRQVAVSGSKTWIQSLVSDKR